jgi:hypothetical protein
MRSAVIALTTAMLVVPQVAQAAEPPCLTPKEATAVAAYAMPSVISGTVQRCAPVLGKDSWLARSGSGLAGRYAERKAAVWPEAKAAILKVAGGSGDPMMDMVRSMPDDSLRPFADSLVVAGIAEKLPANRCAPINRFLSLIAPLPPESTAELVALTLGVLSRSDKPKIGKLPICKAEG